ncbi:hypothetical protein [Methylobacterium aerolatum]|uniref:Uncharacterized protein n=1 Tax=Methylobacterium aerolatum TaxID=418708 RepID=A0ABU0I4I2_9HYPH|nr:hypothetical protein [Methylobacterium aerolatum]MDQ0449509.1 hypothetical protein [Methylobacterium aerolatum]GJD33540.1 hypothetical protein FMGBMHLM_0430 [Methylobacterium aerolatum]
MDATDRDSAMAARDAAEDLLALCWPVRSSGDDLKTWRIGDSELTDEELIGLATRREILSAAGLVQ